MEQDPPSLLKRRRWYQRWWLWAAIVAIVGLLGMRMSSSGTPVESAPVLREKVVRTLALNGRIEAARTVPLTSVRTDRVTEVLADRGDQVKEGQVLAKLDPGSARARADELKSRVAQAEANFSLLKSGASPQRIAQSRQDVGIAEEALKLLTLNLSEVEGLYKQGLTSRNSLDELKTQQAQATMRLEAARQALRDLEKPRPEEVRASQAQLEAAKSQLESALVDLDQTEIKAPFDAVVLDRQIEPGERPGAGGVLFTLRSLEPLQIVANLDERYLGDVKLGQSALVATEAAPQTSYAASVSRIDPFVDPQQGTARLELRFRELPPGSVWRPGLTVDIDIQVAEHPAALTVPRAALRTADSRTRLFVVRDGRAVETPVTVIPWRAERVVVLEGLQEGEQVITTPERVQDGAKVKAKSR